jgi:hypothetical protein
MPEHTKYGIFTSGVAHKGIVCPFLIFRYNETDETYSDIPSYIMYSVSNTHTDKVLNAYTWVYNMNTLTYTNAT